MLSAVEAARAGEAGMGLAVVADEVRNLAHRSAEAAKETTTLIEASIASAQGGSRQVDQTAATIGGITESVSRVKELVDQVRDASRQQAQGIEQVTQAIAQMERVTQTTAATAEENAAAGAELAVQVGAVTRIAESLRRVVGGTGASSGRSR